jgi:DNA-binding response OmpR family regulator
MKLLLVDSDRDMVEMLTTWLKSRGYEVRYAYTGQRARNLWMEHQPDLVIVDPSMKDVDALALCRELRGAHDALVLVLAPEHDIQAEVKCLESGADDFLPKPFLPTQLLAHIKAMSRRVRTTLERHPSTILTVGPLQVDTLRHEVTAYGKVARLTPTESKILHILAANANDVCTLGQIVSHVWGYGESGDTYLIKAHIRHLREKIEVDASKPRFILTVPGVGYTIKRLADEPHSELPRDGMVADPVSQRGALVEHLAILASGEQGDDTSRLA